MPKQLTAAEKRVVQQAMFLHKEFLRHGSWLRVFELFDGRYRLDRLGTACAALAAARKGKRK